ncbi:13001_t:CDS:2, partial [Ambispora leptoticha]
CGSLAVDAYILYEDNRLVCQPCRMKKEGSASSPISFFEQNKGHLDKCQCLEQEAQELYLLFANSLRKMEENLSKCACENSQKVRVSSDDYA